jgi:hypothetical protein
MPHPNYADTRRLFLTNTLATLAEQFPPEQLQAASAAIKEMIDSTYTDQYLFQDFNRMAAEKRAKDLAYAEQSTADLATQRATRAHQDRLTAAHRATEVERERAEALEDKVRELNRAMDDGSH